MDLAMNLNTKPSIRYQPIRIEGFLLICMLMKTPSYFMLQLESTKLSQRVDQLQEALRSTSTGQVLWSQINSELDSHMETCLKRFNAPIMSYQALSIVKPLNSKNLKDNNILHWNCHANVWYQWHLTVFITVNAKKTLTFIVMIYT